MLGAMVREPEEKPQPFGRMGQNHNRNLGNLRENPQG